jgi:hypothetical protein
VSAGMCLLLFLFFGIGSVGGRFRNRLTLARPQL